MVQEEGVWGVKDNVRIVIQVWGLVYKVGRIVGRPHLNNTA